MRPKPRKTLPFDNGHSSASSVLLSKYANGTQIAVRHLAPTTAQWNL